MPQTPEPVGDDAIRDVSEVRAELRAHTRVLNALRETQAEQGRAVAELRTQTEAGFGEMRAGSATLASGMGDITRLLQRGNED